jgi:ABC-2 type transport system permease protein
MKWWSICKREFHSYFTSPIAYLVLTGFVLLSGYFFFNMLAFFNASLERYAQMKALMGANQVAPNLNQWVIEGYFQTLLVVLVFMVPLLTMRLLAEEKRRGTFELLITSPISITDLVIGKFFGVTTVLILMLVGAACFPLLLIVYGNPEVMPIVSGFLGVVLCTLSFASIGMAASAFTENQIVAGVSSMVVLLLLYVIHSPAESIGGTFGEILRYLSPVMQVQDLIKGVISLKSVVYFLSLIGLGLFLSHRALEAERWR